MTPVADSQETFLSLVWLEGMFRTFKAAAVSHLDGLLSFLMKEARNSWELPTSQVQLLVVAKPQGPPSPDKGLAFGHLAARPGDQLEGGEVRSCATVFYCLSEL